LFSIVQQHPLQADRPDSALKEVPESIVKPYEFAEPVTICLNRNELNNLKQILPFRMSRHIRPSLSIFG
jgi:hypothetical protein